MTERFSLESRIRDARVLEALGRVPRREFVPPEAESLAYEDRALAIGEGQTISQPYIVAFMTQELALRPGDRVLEIGTGSGYQSAVLAELGCEVYTVEIRPGLAASAAQRLKRLGYAAVRVRVGDGRRGWPEAAPFDAIIVTCAPQAVPRGLAGQLKVGGRMIVPVGVKLEERSRATQDLLLIVRTKYGFDQIKRSTVRFVPMT